MLSKSKRHLQSSV